MCLNQLFANHEKMIKYKFKWAYLLELFIDFCLRLLNTNYYYEA